jgi:hypothetical protein
MKLEASYVGDGEGTFTIVFTENSIIRDNEGKGKS